MKCPKCEYLGFESSDRCRNCGYEFSLSAQALAEIDLSLGEAEPLTGAPNTQLHSRPPLDLDRIIGGPAPDLPLFLPPADSGQRPASPRRAGAVGRGGGDSDHGRPLVAAPPHPRAPLGVRRATPEVPRARVKTPRLHEETLFEPPAPLTGQESQGRQSVSATEAPATPASRIMAALVDGAILLALDAAVLYFTLRLCNLAAWEILELPAIPLLAFFLMLDGGYSVAFTAVGGQSIGKMAFGIKVVSDEDLPVPFGRATLRTVAYLASALPLGAGFLPGIMGADRLALHDRLAHTRVVRPSSV
jgi:uncharacterized RDD family membrane protein YckC